MSSTLNKELEFVSVSTEKQQITQKADQNTILIPLNKDKHKEKLKHCMHKKTINNNIYIITMVILFRAKKASIYSNLIQNLKTENSYNTDVTIHAKLMQSRKLDMTKENTRLPFV